MNYFGKFRLAGKLVVTSLIQLKPEGLSLLQVFFIGILTFPLMYSSVVNGAELTVQADRWCPYNCEPGSISPGYVVELLQEIFVPRGIEIRYEIVPWDRALLRAREGTTGAVIAATQREIDENGLLRGAEAIGYSSDCLYVAPNNPLRFVAADDLNSLRSIGISSGYEYSGEVDAWLKRAENKGKIILQKGEDPAEINARNLAMGRLEGVIEDDHVMLYAIKKLGIERQVALAGCLKRTEIFVAFSPKLKNVGQFIKEFDEGMMSLHQNQRLSKILSKYGMTDWK